MLLLGEDSSPDGSLRGPLVCMERKRAFFKLNGLIRKKGSVHLLSETITGGANKGSFCGPLNVIGFAGSVVWAQ